MFLLRSRLVGPLRQRTNMSRIRLICLGRDISRMAGYKRNRTISTRLTNMCSLANSTMDLSSRRGSKHNQARLSFESMLVCFLCGTLSILAVGYYLFYKSSQSDALLAEGFRRGDIRVSGLIGRVRQAPPEESSANYDSKATIGYVITITGCPEDDGSRGDFGAVITDGAAVLKHSIHMNSIRNAKSGSKYDYKMYALVHPDAEHCARPTLEPLGYKVLIRSAPVASKYIDGDYLRERISSDGCCGDKEFVKLHAYTLVDHPAVVHLDLDTLVLKPMDSLFDIMIDGVRTAWSQRSVDVAFGEPIVPTHTDSTNDINAFFTRDYNMAHREMKHVGVQGGFIVLRPSLLAFAEFSTLIRKGDFRANSGWGGLGFGPFFGSMTFQGIIPYFYDHFHPGTGVELNRCVYNNMADNPRDEPTENTPSGSCKDGYNRPGANDQCEDCRSRPIEEVVTIHFRLCQKPWECPAIDKNQIQEDICRQFHAEWYRIREDLETRVWGRKPIDLSTKHGVDKERGGNYQYQHSRGYCSSNGKNGYIPLKAPLNTVRGGSKSKVSRKRF